MRPSFTLLETLLAAALLAMLAAACAGVLGAASFAGTPLSISCDELGALADRALRTPASLGLAPLTARGLPSWTMVAWPEEPDREPVRVEVVAGARWVVFSCEGLSVSRWIAPREEAR